MEEKTNYTVVGLIVLFLVAGLLAAGLWLSVGFDKKNYLDYGVYFNEAVSGLGEESIVKYNGVKVGYVRKIRLNKKNPQQVKLLLKLEEGIPITTSTTATLVSQGITGTTFVGLSANSSELTPLPKLPGEDYPIIPAKPSLFRQLDSALKEVTENINKVSLQIRQVFDQQNADMLKKTLTNLQVFTDVIAANSSSIHQIIQNADLFLRNTAEASQTLPHVMQELKVSTHKMGIMADTVTGAGKKVMDTMQTSKTTITNFSQQTIPPAVILLQRLDLIASNLEKLSMQMRLNPSMVIRGTTAPPPGPGE